MRQNFLTELSRLWDQLHTAGPRLTLLAGIDKLARMLKRAPPRRYSQITPQILLGGQPATRVLLWLRRRGVTGIINLRYEYDYSKALGLEGMRYLHLPTPDNQPPSLEHLRQGVTFIHDMLAKGGSVYIHCWEGLGRSPTMVAAYLVSTGQTPKDAWAQIRRIRPFIRPTPAQLQRLDEFASQGLTASVPTRVETPAGAEEPVPIKEVAPPPDPVPTEQSAPNENSATLEQTSDPELPTGTAEPPVNRSTPTSTSLNDETPKT